MSYCSKGGIPKESNDGHGNKYACNADSNVSTFNANNSKSGNGSKDGCAVDQEPIDSDPLSNDQKKDLAEVKQLVTPIPLSTGTDITFVTPVQGFDVVAASSLHGKLSSWSTNGKLLNSLQIPVDDEDEVVFLGSNAGDSSVVAGTSNGDIYKWNPIKNSLALSMKVGNSIECGAVGSDEVVLIVERRTEGPYLSKFNISTGKLSSNSLKLVKVFRVGHISFSTDKRSAVLVSEPSVNGPGNLLAIDVPALKILSRRHCSKAFFPATVFKNSQTVLIGNGNQLVEWDIYRDSETPVFDVLSEEIRTIAILLDSQTLIVRDWIGGVTVLGQGTRREHPDLMPSNARLPSHESMAAVFSAARVVFFADGSPALSKINVEPNGDVRVPIEDVDTNRTVPTCSLFCIEANQLLVGSEFGWIHSFSVTDGSVEWSSSVSDSAISCIASSKDTSVVYVASKRSIIAIESHERSWSIDVSESMGRAGEIQGLQLLNRKTMLLVHYKD